MKQVEMYLVKLKYDFKRVENLVGKVENGGKQHFLLF